MMKDLKLPLLALATALLGGCANHVYFTTNSSIGLDVSGPAGAPNKVSFAFQRFEGAIVPEKSDGTSHSVLGTLDADPFTWTQGQRVKQVFATGEAATIAAAGGAMTDDRAAGTASGTTSNTDKSAVTGNPLVFVTKTTLGLELSAGEPNMSPQFLFGYKRLESTVIPVLDASREVRPVYADIDIDTINKSTSDTGVKGVKISQSFATGKAALLMSAGRSGEALRKAVASEIVEYSASNTSARLRNWLKSAPDRAERVRRQGLLQASIPEDAGYDFADLINDPKYEAGRASFLTDHATDENIPNIP